MTPPMLQIQGLRKRFGAHDVLRGIDLDVQSGDRIAIIGSSGSGKSTLLRCLNFMEIPSAGRVVLKGRAIGTGPGADGAMRYGQAELS
ncbi:MAG: ATP-binding cassette domain-containing protein, partial [Oxalobacteraceae bacterium]